MTPVRGGLDDVETRLPVWISDKNDGLEKRRENFSTSAVIVQNERLTTRSYRSKSQGWARRWAMERLAC